MYSIDLIEYGTNKTLGKCKLAFIPRIGEFLIMAESISEDWKKHFTIVRSVSYTLTGDIILHIQNYDIDEAERKEQALKDKLNELRAKMKGE